MKSLSSARIAAVVVVAAIAAAAGWWGGRRSQSGIATTAEAGREVLYWYDPMVPQQRFDKPGKSPFMDMQLVPRYASEEVDSPAVHVAPGTAQNLGVRLARVEATTVTELIDAAGIVGFNERDVVVVQSRAAGYVQKVWPLAPGDRVVAGAPLVDVHVPEWGAAEREFLAIRLSGDAILIEVARDRLRSLGVEAAEISRLEASGTANSGFILRAPASGVVQDLAVRAGMTLAPGQTLLQINGLDTVWLEIAVPESLAFAVRPGASVKVYVADLAAPPTRGRVSALLPTLDDMTRTLRVRVELPNRDGLLRPGQSARATLESRSMATELSIPTESVIRTGKRALVMLADQGAFRPMEVAIGPERGDRTVILAGLSAGQQVVASGQFLLDSEASLRGLAIEPLVEGQ
jgi:membrane fusion protein, copper/silver efflux system